MIRTIILYSFFLFNPHVIFAQSNNLFDRQILRLDSICCNNDFVSIKDSTTLVFLRCLYRIDSKVLSHCKISTYNSIEMKKSQYQWLKKYLNKNRQTFICRIDSFKKKEFFPKCYNAINIEEQFFFFSILYLEPSLGGGILDFGKLYKNHILAIKKSPLHENIYYIKKNEYHFLSAYDFTTNTTCFDVHYSRISKDELEKVEKWCIENENNSAIQKTYLKYLCENALWTCFYIEI